LCQLRECAAAPMPSGSLIRAALNGATSSVATSRMTLGRNSTECHNAAIA